MAPTSSAQAARELSPEAQTAAGWFRQLGRALRTFRLYRGDNPVVLEAQEQVAASLTELLAGGESWQLRFSANEIYLDDEPVVRMTQRVHGVEFIPCVTDRLPFMFYGDGVRRLKLQAGMPRHEVDTLVRILRLAASGPSSQDDLVTLLWQTNLAHVQLEAVPLEQTIYLSSRAGGGRADGLEKKGQVYAWSPTGSEIRADLGQAAGSQGLHRDTFDDWVLPAEAADVPGAFDRLLPLAEAARPAFLAGFEAENRIEWAAQIREFMRALIALDGSEDMRRAMARSTITWLGATLQRVAWDEAQRALELLNEIDPEHVLCAGELTAALSALDAGAMAERLDEGDVADHSRFAAFTVALGQPAIGFCVDVMAHADKARARAAAVTALCYLCADEPEMLTPWLEDSRWYVVRNVVFVLGHIGGPAVAPMLHNVAHHPEPRVRRTLVQALGSVPPEERAAILVEQLDAEDAQLLAGTLNMLTREKDRRAARAILARIEAPGFESRDEAAQRAFFGALGEIADDEDVPALEALLHKGGWFACRTVQRVAAARTLRRIGTERATAALEAGLRARSEAVRAACIEALGTRGRP